MPTHRPGTRTQYFEMLGNRAIYHEGWVAATTPATLPWELSTKPAPDVITGYKWELYNVEEDPTQFNDLAAKMPDKLQQMQQLFYLEAAKHDVLPMDNSSLTRWNTPRPNLTAGRTEFTYRGTLSGVPNSGAPNILNKSFTITAEVTIPKGGAEGMIVTDGGRFGGYGLFLSKGVAGVRRGKPVFLYNLLNLKRTVWDGPELSPGKHTIVFDFKSAEPGLGKGGTGVLYVDGKEVAQKVHGELDTDHLPRGRDLRRRHGHAHRRRADRVPLRPALQVHRQHRPVDLQADPGSAAARNKAACADGGPGAK